MTELEQLKQDHATIKAAVDVHKRYGQATPSETIDYIESRIAQLEAEADPWRYVNEILHRWGNQGPTESAGEIARFVRHLKAENAAKDARIAELEAREVPPLDRARVWVTAEGLSANEINRGLDTGWRRAEPYPLQEPK